MPKYLTRQSPGIHIRPPHYKYDNEKYYHETNPEVGGAAYKLGMGEDLNNLLAIAEKLMQNPDAPFDDERTNRDLFEAIHGIVDRTAQCVDLEAEAEAVEARYVPDRKKAYRAVHDRFVNSRENDNYCASAAADKYLGGKREIHRFCVVKQGPCDFLGDTMVYTNTNADHDTMEAARKCAIRMIFEDNGRCRHELPCGDACPESSMAIIDLDTGEEWEADFTTIQWRTVVKEENQ